MLRVETISVTIPWCLQMKAIGVVRKPDSVGHYVLPKELKRSLDIKIGNLLEIFVEKDSIILKKYEPSCIFLAKRAE